jgi:glycosyltransferase involved in cell wall biosynthesis
MIRDQLISIFVPARDEEGNIEPLLSKLDKTIRDNQLKAEVVIVNDGSSDRTGEILDESTKKFPFLKVFHHKTGKGLSAAMDTGFGKCRGDFILFLPADLESDPEEDVPVLLEGLEKNYDVVLGWREGRADGKNIASKVYNAISGKLFDVHFHDMNWIKGFTREAMDALDLRKDWHRFIVHILYFKGYSITEVRTNWHSRQYGQSKFNWTRILTSFVDVFVVWLTLKFSKSPMRIFATLGVILISIGVAMGIVLLVIYILYETQYRPLFTTSLILIVTGLQVVFSGFIAEMLVGMQMKIKKLEKKLDAIEKD